MNSDITTEMRVTLRSLLGNPEEEVGMEFLLQSVADDVRRYCKVHQLSEPLQRMTVHIACDRYRAMQPGNAEVPLTVSSVTDGTQSVSFRTPGGEASPTAGFTAAEKAMLNAYRKVW